MATPWNRAGHYSYLMWFLPFIFFLSFFTRLFSAITDYFHGRCGLSANLGCRSEMYCMWLAENTRCKKSPKIRDLNSNISPTCTHNMVPTSGWDLFVSLGHPSKFQWVLYLGFITAATSLTGRQPNYAQCVAVSWAGAVYIHFFRGSCSLTEFCQVHNSLCI